MRLGRTRRGYAVVSSESAVVAARHLICGYASQYERRSRQLTLTVATCEPQRCSWFGRGTQGYHALPGGGAPISPLWHPPILRTGQVWSKDEAMELLASERARVKLSRMVVIDTGVNFLFCFDTGEVCIHALGSDAEKMRQVSA
jgi:hypothetical protein